MRKNMSSENIKSNENNTQKNDFRIIKSNSNDIFVWKIDTENLYRHKKDLYDFVRSSYPILH